MALLELSGERSSRSTVRRFRWAGAVLVALLHLGLLLLLLQSLKQPAMLPALQHEMMLVLAPLAKPKPPVPIVTATIPRRSIARPNGPIRVLPSPQPNSDSPPRINDLGLSLFGCDPEHLSSLTPEQRAHCGNAPDMASMQSALPGAVQERAAQAGRWAASSARDHGPLDVPCAQVGQSHGAGFGRTGTGGMVDLVCIYEHWQNDFEPPEGR
jgi:hypothetical protein